LGENVSSDDTTASTQSESLWRDFTSTMQKNLVDPARWSFTKANSVKPAVLRVLTYPLAALLTVAAWAFGLTVLLLILGLVALFTWISAGYTGKVISDAERQAARHKVQVAKAERLSRKSRSR
jgi:hypothetical protein